MFDECDCRPGRECPHVRIPDDGYDMPVYVACAKCGQAAHPRNDDHCNPEYHRVAAPVPAAAQPPTEPLQRAKSPDWNAGYAQAMRDRTALDAVPVVVDVADETAIRADERAKVLAWMRANGWGLISAQFVCDFIAVPARAPQAASDTKETQ